jgi:hypothetical protein
MMATPESDFGVAARIAHVQQQAVRSAAAENCAAAR